MKKCHSTDSRATAVTTAVPQLARPAAPRTGLARRRLGQLGRRCRRCYRYCGILFIAVVCLMLYNILYLTSTVVCINI